jgi:hypothetical protein
VSSSQRAAPSSSPACFRGRHSRNRSRMTGSLASHGHRRTRSWTQRACRLGSWPARRSHGAGGRHGRQACLRYRTRRTTPCVRAALAPVAQVAQLAVTQAAQPVALAQAATTYLPSTLSIPAIAQPGPIGESCPNRQPFTPNIAARPSRIQSPRTRHLAEGQLRRTAALCTAPKIAPHCLSDPSLCG